MKRPAPKANVEASDSIDQLTSLMHASSFQQFSPENLPYNLRLTESQHSSSYNKVLTVSFAKLSGLTLSSMQTDDNYKIVSKNSQNSDRTLIIIATEKVTTSLPKALAS